MGVAQLGDEINATFGMEGGTILTYTSREDQRETLHDGSWGVTLTGQPSAAPPHDS